MFRVLMSALVVWGLSGLLARAEKPERPERSAVVYRLQHASVNDVGDIVSRRLKAERAAMPKSDAPRGPRIVVGADVTSNSLIVSGPRSEMKRIGELIKHLDIECPNIQPPMVRVEVMILETSQDGKARSSKRNSTKNAQDEESSERVPMSGEQLKKELGLAAPTASAAGKNVSAKIIALEQAGRLRVIICPQLVTLDNRAAKLTVGYDQPYVTGTSASKYGKQNSVSYRKIGLDLTVTPHVSPGGVITMEINLSESHFGAAEEGTPIEVTNKEILRIPRVTMTNP